MAGIKHAAITDKATPESGDKFYLTDNADNLWRDMDYDDLRAALIDANGEKITLDADGDTSITADTDDQIDFEAGGSDVCQLINGQATFDATGSAQAIISSSDLATGTVGAYVFRGHDDGGNDHNYARIAASVETSTDTSEDGQMFLQCARAGSTTAIMLLGDGVQVGSPTGGYPGLGKLNAVEVQDDGSTLTDYVFDAYHGDMSVEDYSEPVSRAASDFNPDWMDVETFSQYWKLERRLPGMPDLNDCIDGRVKMGLGAQIHKLTQIVELQAIHIDALKQEIDAIKR